MCLLMVSSVSFPFLHHFPIIDMPTFPGHPSLPVSSWVCPVLEDWRVEAGVSLGSTPGRAAAPPCCCPSLDDSPCLCGTTQLRLSLQGPGCRAGTAPSPPRCCLCPTSSRVFSSRKLLSRHQLSPVCSSVKKKHIHLTNSQH